MKSQNATSRWGGKRKLPYAFTEHGALMLSTVLNSNAAVEVSVIIVRAFVKLRQMLSENQELAAKFKELEKMMNEKFEDHDKKLQMVFEALRELMFIKNKPRKSISYKRK